MLAHLHHKISTPGTKQVMLDFDLAKLLYLLEKEDEKVMKELPKLFGDVSEDLATGFLEQEGFVILERNYFARKLGEVDIIAQKENILHFVEVKSGKADFDPIYNITPAKLQKVINSAHYYMKTKNLDIAFSIDALIVRYDEVEFLENVTL